VFDDVGDLWASLLDGRRPTDRQLALFTTLYPHSVGVCADVVQLGYKAAGDAAVYQKGPLDRCLRDVLTANRHVVATMRTYEMAVPLLTRITPFRPAFDPAVSSFSGRRELYQRYHSGNPVRLAGTCCALYDRATHIERISSPLDELEARNR
jgi:Acyl-CoA dehydrogenase, C-terminal domain